ncbi:MAG: TIGR00303 family protein, partial [Thermoplasmata archaeon]
KKAMSRLKFPITWKTALKELGDPMMAFINGFVPEFEGSVYLAGGTQMLAVAALLKEQGIKVKKITTTRYITEDKLSSFKKTAAEIGAEYYSAPLNFSRSKYKGLRDYESGMVKEGVGAGGAVYIAEKNGISISKITERVEQLYSKFFK